MSSSASTTNSLEVISIPNFRDIGDGSRVRQGLVFRSADPSKASNDTLASLNKDFGIKIIFDLRSSYEVEKHRPDTADTNHFEQPFSEYGMQRRWTPVFENLDFSPDKVPQRYLNYTIPGSEGYVNAYRNILQSASPAFTVIFEHLAKPQPEACVIHCTVGKDRTGVLVALLLMLVGETKDNIGREYSLTDQGLEKVKPMYLERLLEREEFKNNMQGAINLLSSRSENMEATVEMIQSEFGGAEGYMKDYCEMSEEAIEQLKRNLKVSLTLSD